ncbi:hypothetical protein [Mycolicibacterium sp.]|uniref:hypothetical protein n=1 Tax=Mycolicibacterium sp. TaxID=2320850 RepID=UPI0025D5152B|nr:hypothetical protein [Mycolicibacterium sp.]
MRHGDYAWLALAAAILGYELAAADRHRRRHPVAAATRRDWELLSEAFNLLLLETWGPMWGQGGFFKIGFDVFKPLLADFGDVVVPKKIR